MTPQDEGGNGAWPQHRGRESSPEPFSGPLRPDHQLVLLQREAEKHLNTRFSFSVAVAVAVPMPVAASYGPGNPAVLLHGGLHITKETGLYVSGKGPSLHAFLAAHLRPSGALSEDPGLWGLVHS